MSAYTLNRVRTPTQDRRLVEVAANGTATPAPLAVVDTDLAAATTRGRFVIDDTAAPLDGDEYVLPGYPVQAPAP